MCYLHQQLPNMCFDCHLKMWWNASIFFHKYESICVNNPDVGNKDDLCNSLMSSYEPLIKHINHQEVFGSNRFLDMQLIWTAKRSRSLQLLDYAAHSVRSHLLMRGLRAGLLYKVGSGIWAAHELGITVTLSVPWPCHRDHGGLKSGQEANLLPRHSNWIFLFGCDFHQAAFQDQMAHHLNTSLTSLLHVPLATFRTHLIITHASLIINFSFSWI